MDKCDDRASDIIETGSNLSRIYRIFGNFSGVFNNFLLNVGNSVDFEGFSTIKMVSVIVAGSQLL